jgi:hypothetical protein
MVYPLGAGEVSGGADERVGGTRVYRSVSML